ncbi:hypothetical protein C2S52_013500 [Perilla frutescens var. hirtella]|nr:hypothetical protein C2S52_013500 [Perilla frutescens var. hirtella]
MEPPKPLPHIHSPCRRSSHTNSPEFEFSMVGNPSFPQPNLLSADQLFSGGFLLPLHLLQLSTQPPPPPPQDTEATEPSSTIESATNSTTNNSRRWRHIFKKKLVSSSIRTRSSADDHPTKEKDVREKKGAGALAFGAGNVVSAAELNINIWPFSRSRSAGNGGMRPRPAPATRKVSSAPCSRSNSTGDQSKSRKWPHSPARQGVHLGKNSPVWQVRRGGGGGGRSSEALVKNVEKGAKRDGRKIPASKPRVLSLNVPMCIGYRNHLSCRHDVSGAAARGGQIEGGVSSEVVRRSNLFNIRSIFTKKVN